MDENFEKEFEKELAMRLKRQEEIEKVIVNLLKRIDVQPDAANVLALSHAVLHLTNASISLRPTA